MKTMILFFVLLSTNADVFAQADIKNKNWYLYELEINDQVYERPINDEANEKNSNFFITEFTHPVTNITAVNAAFSFCYSYDMGGEALDETLGILYVQEYATLAINQDCDLEENNNFDDLYESFWFIFDETRNPITNPYQFAYEVVEEGNTEQLIITNELGDKAYYNHITASVEEFDSIAINVYPNPVTSILYIDLQAVLTNDIILEMYDINGKKIKSIASQRQSELQIDVTDVPNGLYFIKLNYKDSFAKSFIYKITKN